ncbi:hypothetical protein NBRC116495_07330 [Aurantivibrio plasticivorans]
MLGLISTIDLINPNLKIDSTRLIFNRHDAHRSKSLPCRASNTAYFVVFLIWGMLASKKFIDHYNSARTKVNNK